MITRRDTCRLCGSKDRELALPLEATPSGEDYIGKEELSLSQQCFPMDLFLCHSCGHAEFPDVIAPDLLYRNYKYRTSISLGLVEHFGRYAREVMKVVRPAKDSLVVDIGSNDGSLLRFFKEGGNRVLGVDPARAIAQTATAAGIETLPVYFAEPKAKEIRQSHGAATIITANNVFANIDDLTDFAAGVRELLAPDGVFVFETSYLLDVLGNMLIETFFHEHLSYFSARPLQAYFRRHGLELFDVQHVPTKGGSIRGFVQKAGGARPVTSAVSEQVSKETVFGLPTSEPYQACHKALKKVKTDLHDLISPWKKNGSVVAGYGASVGVTTLLYQFELGKALDFLVDDNPIRQGLFSPGQHIPVFASSDLYSRTANYVVVLAWAYLDPIMKKHAEFAKKGGQFIVPLPSVRVVKTTNHSSAPAC
jgi:SAM-dependent methyltransferase